MFLCGRILFYGATGAGAGATGAGATGACAGATTGAGASPGGEKLASTSKMRCCSPFHVVGW